ncbi:hypothetical protein Slin15195_G001850 [Septoria linicola]|uniref:Mid2 domain-containing protein n=1 Tax=Septoria linicola TaxID=215465 RepID=A0A9Q9AJ49_9PEZI|nr:hypothetical protein Slin14017_G001880 [Septoria linicola]USW46866.1 hypothetical protein Slin15195_G001850 [Septoria linicola]
MRTSTLCIVLASISSPLAAAAAAATPQQCYYPDGSESPDTPCNATAAAAKGGFSACCSETSYCMDNGLCLEAGILTRMSCTDKTFADKTCPQYCNTENQGDPYELTPCTATTFTCGLSPANCSIAASVFPVPDLKDIVLQADQLVTAMSAAGLATASIDPTSTPTETIPILTVTATGVLKPSDPAMQYTMGQLVGVGAGVGVPMALAIGILSFFLLQEKKKHTVAEIDEGGFRPPPTSESQSRDGNSWSAWSETTKINAAAPSGLHSANVNAHGGVPRRPTNMSSHHIQELDGGPHLHSKASSSMSRGGEI